MSDSFEMTSADVHSVAEASDVVHSADHRWLVAGAKETSTDSGG